MSDYTDEDILQLQQLFLPRPAAVDEARWLALQPQKPQSARELMTRAIAADPTILDSKKETYRPLLPAAVGVLADALQGNDITKAQLTASIHVMEQGHGKAQQSIEHTGNVGINLRKMALENEERDRELIRYKRAELAARDVTNSVAIDNGDAKLEAFLNDNGITDYTVGKRGKSGERSEQQPGQGHAPGAAISIEAEASESES